jgi:hypothetical protein
MTVIPGASATLTVPGHTQKFFQVSLNVNKTLIPVPAYGESWISYVAGLKDASGSLMFYVSKDGSSTNPFEDGSGTLTIQFDTGCSIAFDAITGGVSIVGDANGVNVATMSFAKQGDDDPSISWDETT